MNISNQFIPSKNIHNEFDLNSFHIFFASLSLSFTPPIFAIAYECLYIGKPFNHSFCNHIRAGVELESSTQCEALSILQIKSNLAQAPSNTSSFICYSELLLFFYEINHSKPRIAIIFFHLSK